MSYTPEEQWIRWMIAGLLAVATMLACFAVWQTLS